MMRGLFAGVILVLALSACGGGNMAEPTFISTMRLTVPPVATATPERAVQAYVEAVTIRIGLFQISHNEATQALEERDHQTSITFMKLAHSSLQKVAAEEPPARFSAAHAKLVEAADHYGRAVTFYEAGVNEVDPDLIALATSELEEVSRLLREAIALLD